MGDESSWKARLIVVVQVVTAIVSLTLAFRYVSSGYNVKFDDAKTPERRLVYTFKYLAISLAPLVFAIGQVANARFFTKAIDPLSGNDHLILVKQRILVNTLEQFMIHAFALLSLSTYLDESTFKFIPLLCCLFFAGRVLFTVGYYINPLVRGLGFGLTFYPTILVLAHILWKMFHSEIVNWLFI